MKTNFMNKVIYILIKRSSIFCFLIFIALSSCSKENIVTKTEPISLSAEKSQYAPYEIVTISASENLFLGQSFSAKINDIDIIVNSTEKIASFILPNLPNGSYNLKFKIADKNYIVPITVLAMSNISDANTYFTQIQTNINQNITTLNLQITQLEQNSATPNEYANLRSDVIKYTTLLNDYTTAFNNLSATDKLEFAKSVAANKANIDEYNNLTNALQSSIVLLRSTQSVQDYESGVDRGKVSLVRSVIFTVGHIPVILAGAQIATTPNPWVSAGAILATGIITANFMINVIETAIAGVNLTDKAIKPYQFLTQQSQVVYSTGIETTSSVQAKYRSLINTDGSNSGGTINTIVETYKSLRDKVNGFVNSLPTIFRPSYVIRGLKNTFNNTTRSIFNQYVSISNVSNPNVTLQQLNQPDGSIKVKATNTATTDQTFTYNVNYTNNNFASGLSQIVSAKVLRVSDTISSIRTMLEGKIWNAGKTSWTVTSQSNSQIKFADCCYGGSQSNYYWLFRYNSLQNKVYVDGISGFNGYTQTFELVSISPTAFSIKCIAGSNCIISTISNFPR